MVERITFPSIEFHYCILSKFSKHGTRAGSTVKGKCRESSELKASL